LERVLDELARRAADGGNLGAEPLAPAVAQQPDEQLPTALAGIRGCADASHYP
jgi:hypothetical protein